MEAQSSQSVIPENELRCVWMDAGVVEFKLCDRAFECESCEFDSLIRRQREFDEQAAFSSPPSRNAAGREARSAEELFVDSLRKRLAPLQGQRLLEDRLYHRSHYWLRPETDETYQFGIDHIAANLIHPVLSIVLPNAPFAVRRHDPFCWIVLTGGPLPLRSPVDGVILQYNEDLKRHPSLINDEPYERGLIMNVKLGDRKRGLSNFLRSEEAAKKIGQQFEDVKQAFLQAFRQSKPTAGATLFDGGVRLENIEVILGPPLFLNAVDRAMNSAF
jgi:glycine cleavage system H lipoate-binding protein